MKTQKKNHNVNPPKQPGVTFFNPLAVFPKLSTGQAGEAPERELAAQLASSGGRGQALPGSTQRSMGQAFGRDLKGVRVHTDEAAVQMNEGLGARAFTHGSDIYFNQGEYNPESSEGKRLLGHELTHVVQQTGIISSQIINRKLLCRNQRTLRDFGQLFSPTDVATLGFRRGRRPYEIIDRGRRGPYNDAFRVRLIREIINSSAEVLLIRTSMAANSPPHDLYRNGRLVRQNVHTPLIGMARGGAGGVHFPARSLALAHSNYTGPVSRVTNRSYVVYQDPLSLGHELFGHAYLAIKGASFGHGQTIPASANIRGPNGTRYLGSVNDFIRDYASEVRLGFGSLHFSPTRILSWPTPTGGSVRMTYVAFRRHYPNAMIMSQGGRRYVIFP